MELIRQQNDESSISLPPSMDEFHHHDMLSTIVHDADYLSKYDTGVCYVFWDVIEFIDHFENAAMHQEDLIEALPKANPNNMQFYCKEITIIRKQMRRLREDKIKLVKLRMNDFVPEH